MAMVFRFQHALRRTAAHCIALCALLAALPGTAQQYVPQKDDRFPKIRFADGLESLNDRCPVRLGKLNTKMDPIYVNGRPLGFC